MERAQLIYIFHSVLCPDVTSFQGLCPTAEPLYAKKMLSKLGLISVPAYPHSPDSHKKLSH